MKSIVLDCSIALSWCFEDESKGYPDEVLDYIKRNGALVPPIWMLEITNGLLNAEKRKRISIDGALGFLELFSHLPIRVVGFSTSEYLLEVFKLARVYRLTTYDACYLYLAVREKIPLATLDTDLKKASRNCKLPKIGAQ